MNHENTKNLYKRNYSNAKIEEAVSIINEFKGRLGISRLLHVFLKIKANRIPWIKSMLHKVISDILKGDFSKISLNLKRYLKYRRF